MDKSTEISLSRTPIKTVKVEARGEEFRIVQLQGNLFVCSKEHGNCCCGWTEKGRAPVNLELYQAEWERRRIRNKIHLSFTGCLGPCAVGNSVMLQLSGHSIWFKDLNDDKYIHLIFDYIEALLKDLQAVPPTELSSKIYERFLPATVESVKFESRAETIVQEEEGLEGIDPVCLMEVDPATARWKAEYAGKEYFFCAPSCKKLFVAEPQAYL